MRFIQIISIAFAISASNCVAQAAVVSWSILSSTSAQFDSLVDNDQSTVALNAIQSFVSAENSLTQTDLNWDWDGTQMLSSSTLTAQKVISARRGGDHLSQSSLVFEFTIDSMAQLSLSGTWGFLGASPGGDSLSIQLLSASGAIYSDSTSSNTGTASDSFGFSSILGPGTYTFSIQGSLAETINSQHLAQAGWNLSDFQLHTMPEPSAALAVLSVLSIPHLRRKRSA